jgi:cytosine deaminase
MLPPPDAEAFVLANATLPTALAVAPPAGATGDLFRADIAIDSGKVTAIAPPGSLTGSPCLDLDGGMVWPAFVDMHTHIDKGHISPRRPNGDGTFAAAVAAVRADREANWSAEDVRRRMDFSLRCAYAHGTALLRTHIDSLPPQPQISWPVFREMRAEWAGRIDLQAVSLVTIDHVLDDAYGDLVDIVRQSGGVLGASTPMGPHLDIALDRIMRIAADNGLDLDFHVDETGDPAACALRHIADTAIRLRFPGRITVGHCCSLAVQPPEEAAATLDRVAEAGLCVVSLPMCNMYLQDRRGGRTPRWRGVTLLHEMAARRIPVAVASDNTRDPFYAYGDLDVMEVFREAVRIAHLDHPVADWPRAVTMTPADILRRPDRGRLEAGMAADLVLFRARDWTELLARPQQGRTVLRAGKAIDTTLPDYRELDDIMARTLAAAAE